MNNSLPKKCAEYYRNGDYPVDLKSKVHPFVRSGGPDSSIPPPPVVEDYFVEKIETMHL